MPDMIAAVVVAGGRGLRVGGDIPKQYRELGGEPVIRPALSAFLDHPHIVAVQPVIHREDEAMFRAATAGLHVMSLTVWPEQRDIDAVTARWSELGLDGKKP